MHSAFVNVAPESQSGRFGSLAILIVVIGVSVPLFRRLRRSISEKRKRRWVEQGLMDQPPLDPPPGETSA